MTTAFSGFDAYKLNRVQVTKDVLGKGAYSKVLKLKYMGLTCAGKKIHDIFLEENAAHTIHRYQEECRLLCKLQHPNIVHCLGIYVQKEFELPILVMEYLPTNLTACIEKYDMIPNEISYSILHDVSLGLCYLHNKSPSIIHRDLSSNNVLLNSNMTAKISDLGLARILNITPLQSSRMTAAPGTIAYMPPEVLIENPKYDTSIDVFSFGILMIHIFCSKWPVPQVPQVFYRSGMPVICSEADRREVFLRDIPSDHPLMELIQKCIENDSTQRPHAAAIVDKMQSLVSKYPSPFPNRLEMLRRIEADKAERKRFEDDLRSKNQEIQDIHAELDSLKQEMEQRGAKAHMSNFVQSVARINARKSNKVMYDSSYGHSFVNPKFHGLS